MRESEGLRRKPEDGIPTMQLSAFLDIHRPALEEDQARHNLMLGLLVATLDRPEPELRLWSLGRPGQCAMQTPGRAVILGDLREDQCHRFAEETVDLGLPGVIGPDDTATWFAQRASELGVRFQEPIPQRIHTLSAPPTYPGAPGHPRPAGPGDATLFADWMTCFIREAVPHDPIAPREELEARASDGQHWFWIVDDEPVSLAGIVRRTRDAAVVAAVYTPLHCRNRGFAGSIVAAVVERIFAEGRKTACLYTDLNNPASNRCYAKVGFRPVCNSWLYLRDTG
jgi:hypothetical protein